MDDIRRVPSSVFRVTYVNEKEPVAVTVVGRVIGHWVPISTSIDARFADALRPGEPPTHEAPDAAFAPVSPSPSGVSRTLKPRAGMDQAARDAILRKVAKR